MHERILLVSIIAGALGAAGCQSRATEAASAGAPPAIGIPVGPMPGPGQPPPQPTNPYEGNNVALSEGRQLFVYYNCYGCHGGHGGGGMGPSLRDPDWIYGSSDAHVFASIAEGRAHGMPAWGTKLPQDQIWKLVAYIKSMGTPSEPQPPPPFPGNTPSDKQVMKR
jgi:cytochrome c oxidase cbb3-type subunit 3